MFYLSFIILHSSNINIFNFSSTMDINLKTTLNSFSGTGNHQRECVGERGSIKSHLSTNGNQVSWGPRHTYQEISTGRGDSSAIVSLNHEQDVIFTLEHINSLILSEHNESFAFLLHSQTKVRILGHINIGIRSHGETSRADTLDPCTFNIRNSKPNFGIENSANIQALEFISKIFNTHPEFAIIFMLCNFKSFFGFLIPLIRVIRPISSPLLTTNTVRVLQLDKVFTIKFSNIKDSISMALDNTFI
mmetsp:Transcript_963/g.881  ORF Transcript_963/g.881 Transcript_963/m.881 type:complete len:247 (+) Transcript_963:194-934(+)